MLENQNINNISKEELQEYKHKNRERLCYYTNELYNEDELVKYTLKNRGYGSIFDGDNFTIQINKYIAKALEDENILKTEWFDNDKVIMDLGRGFVGYKHENEIGQFIKSLIIENREYIENCDNWLMGKIDRYDWIKDEYKHQNIILN